MSRRNFDNRFLLLLLLSLMVHGMTGYLLVISRHAEHNVPDTYFVELRDIPSPLQHDSSIPPNPPIQLSPDKKSPADNPLANAKPADLPQMPLPSPDKKSFKPSASADTKPKIRQAEPFPDDSFFRKRKEAVVDISRLYPSGRGLAGIEENYRKRYSSRTGGDTLFLDSDDEILGSYSKRFLDAVRGRWLIVGRRLIMNKDAGYGLLLIIINRSGTVENVQVVESSGNARVDEEIVRTIRTAGYVGPLPKKWPYDRVQGYYIYSAGYDMTN